MSQKSEALQEIARLLGGDEGRARELCRSIQDQVQPAPSYIAIAAALAHHEMGRVSTAELAQLAAQTHRVIIYAERHPEILANPVEDTESSEESESNVESLIDPAIQSATSTFVEAISRHLISTIFAGSIEGKVIGFTGDGPYLKSDLVKLADKLKAITDPEMTWDHPEWVVIGNHNFSTDYLQNVAGNPEILPFTQEEFLGVLLCEDAPLAPSQDVAIEDAHEGFKYLKFLIESRDQVDEVNELTLIETGEEEPSGYAESQPSSNENPGQELHKAAWKTENGHSWNGTAKESEFDPDGLKAESALRECGYTVRKGTHVVHRQLALQRGFKELGFTKVVSHLEWLIQTRRHLDSQQNAVVCWEADLNWFKRTHGSYKQ